MEGPQLCSVSQEDTDELKKNFVEIKEHQEGKKDNFERTQIAEEQKHDDKPHQFVFERAEACFIEWAKQNAATILSLEPSDNNSDLEAIAGAIGNAKFVALSEGFHNCKEMMSLHYRIIRYLRAYHAFNTVLSESGLPESRIIYDYVQGKEISGNVWQQGLKKCMVHGKKVANW